MHAYRPPRPFSVRLRGPELGTASLTVLGGAGATVLALEDAFGFAAARQRLTLQPKSDVALAPTTTLAQLGTDKLESHAEAQTTIKLVLRKRREHSDGITAQAAEAGV